MKPEREEEEGRDRNGRVFIEWGREKKDGRGNDFFFGLRGRLLVLFSKARVREKERWREKNRRGSQL